MKGREGEKENMRINEKHIGKLKSILEQQKCRFAALASGKGQEGNPAQRVQLVTAASLLYTVLRSWSDSLFVI